MIILTLKLNITKYSVTQCQTQRGDLRTAHKIKESFCIPEFSTENIMSWEFHVDDFAEISYFIILSRYLLTSLVINLKFPKQIIEGCSGPFESYTEPIVDLGTYEFKIVNVDKITSKEYFTDAYLEELFEL